MNLIKRKKQSRKSHPSQVSHYPSWRHTFILSPSFRHPLGEAHDFCYREMGEFIVTFPKAPALQPSQPQPPSQPHYAGTLWGDDELAQPEILSQS
jgi:hypothetical protein